MDIVNSSSNAKDRAGESESLSGSYSYFPDSERFDPSLNDKEKILSDEYENIEIKKKKKKKKKRVHINEMGGPDNDDRNPPETNPDENKTLNVELQRSIPLEDLRSNERLQKIVEEFSEDPKTREKMDIRHLALQQALNRQGSSERRRHYDYILVHKTGDNNHTNDKLREIFETELAEEGLKIERKYTTLNTFVILHCPFERLCIEAEFVALEMPLAGYVVPEVGERSCLSKLGDKFKTDNEVDFVSAPFCVSKKNIYEGIRNPDHFFRPALRSLLVNHILTTIDIRDKESRQLGQNPQGLPYMLLEGAYSDAFIVHEKSLDEKRFALQDDGDENESFMYGQDVIDPRRSLKKTWLKLFKFQPLWKIRNYFGEKIALYFAWLGSLTFSLLIPMLFGLAVFLWGLIVATIKWYDEILYVIRIQENPLEQKNSTVSSVISKWAKNAFDNSVTPYFALIICLWGTIFLEFWKRTNARLAYQWDVDYFEDQEPNRPEFYGTEVRPDPVTGEDEPFYPLTRRVIKMAGSSSLLLFMVCLVLASLFAVIIYRIIAREDLFKSSGLLGTTIASVTSTFLNTCSIMIMGKVYQVLAVKLTNWENHRTRTSYDDALIIKLFGFQFVNSYTSLFYIAFFRRDTTDDGVLGFGPAYNDACGSNNDCMTLLSLQVAMLMIMKPLPKLFTDVIIPFVKRIWREHCCHSNKVEEAGKITHTLEDFLDYELHKEPLGDFTLSEYTEKVLQYGFLMLFAAAFPLAPLIALLTNLIDMKLDARRLLWVNRRPIAYRAQDIGMWYGILEFLNIIGVVTNGFLVTFTSDYGKHWEGYSNSTVTNHTTINPDTNQTTIEHILIQQPKFSRLWLLIGFEHVVFAFKFIIAWLIPDTPTDVCMAQRREKHHIADILAKAGMRKGPGNRLAESSSSHRGLATSKSSPGRMVSNQPHHNQTSPGHTSTTEPGTSGDNHLTKQSNVQSPKKDGTENHASSHRTRLEPLPVNYMPKMGQMSMQLLHKDV